MSPDPAYTAWRDAIAERHQAELDDLRTRLATEEAATQVAVGALYAAAQEATDPSKCTGRLCTSIRRLENR